MTVEQIYVHVNFWYNDDWNINGKDSLLGSKYLTLITSMYGIFTYVWLIFIINVAKYTTYPCASHLPQKRLYPSPCLLMFLRDCKCQEPRFSAPRSYLATVPPQIAYLRRGQYFLSIGEYEKLSLYKYTNHFRLIFLAKLEKTLWTINMLKPKNMEIWNMIFLLTVGWVFFRFQGGISGILHKKFK